MTARLPYRVSVAALAMLLTTACSPAGEGRQAQAPSPAATATTATASEQAAPASTSARVGKTRRHPNGTTLVVQSIATEGDAITVGLRAFNGSGRRVALAGAPDGAVLTDDAGTVYDFVPPAGNPALRIGPGERLRGTLAFVGPVAPDAASLRLRFNVAVDDPRPDVRNQPAGTTRPRFDVALPIP